MANLSATDIRPFLPALDFDESKDFYVALGWSLKWSDDKLALLQMGDHSIYLQRYYVREWAENSMLHLTVEDAQSCYEQVTRVLSEGRFPEARVAAPKREPYGAVVTYVWDPSGVLLHLAQWITDK
jgi:catechol 2,3-dioxygenase-like lactoylglutathione lyase family enzyme